MPTNRKRRLPHVKEFDSVMLDLETWGNRPGCVIVSIGAVEFNRKTGEMGREFYVTVDAQSCMDVGLTVQASTIEWWLMQNEEARKAILKDKVSIHNAISRFNLWFNKNQTIWGNGLGFDVSILKCAMYAIGIDHPWKYDAERDVRTYVAEAPEIRKSIKFVGTRHEPIADCKHQIEYLCKTINEVIKKKRK